MRFLGSHNIDICAQQYLMPITTGELNLTTILRKEDIDYESFASCLIETEKLCENKTHGYELGVKANMLRFVYLLFHESSLSKKRHSNDRLKNLLQFIENNYMHTIHVDDAARTSGYSVSHFMRWFKQVSGSSFTSYLNERRLVEAAKMLKKGNETILSISTQVGFDNLSNFNRQFKKLYGCSPKDYRKSNKTNQ